jgi:hypothetical protein
MTDYQILQKVAKEEGFPITDLVEMWQLESSRGTHPDRNKGKYQGHFQLSSAIAKKYGLKPEDRDDLELSARAVIKYRKDNLKNLPNTLKSYKDLGIDKSMVGYLAHQQGRFGIQDIITGLASGNFSGENTRWNILNNLGVAVKDRKNDDFTEDFKRVNKYFQDNPEGRQKIAAQYLSFWKTKDTINKKEAKDWIAEEARKLSLKKDIESFRPDETVVDSVLAN